jgi:archaellum component FlaG (FlaF/FlaG flagellin family)
LPFCANCGREFQEGAAFCPNCGYSLRPAPKASAPISFGGIDDDASTARTLTLVAIILQAIFFAIGILGVLFFVISIPISSTSGSHTVILNGTLTTITQPTYFTSSAPSIAFGIFGLVLVFVFAISILWIALDYFLVYRNLESPVTIPSARSPALVLGILQLIFAGVIPGILLIVAYVKIGDSMRRRGQTY